MTNSTNADKDYKGKELEERTFEFAKSVANFCKILPNTQPYLEYRSQLIRSSSSIGANYIEANEALGKKDFYMRIRICRKEAKESAYWLKLIIETGSDNFKEEGQGLYSESGELRSIFSAILNKSKV